MRCLFFSVETSGSIKTGFRHTFWSHFISSNDNILAKDSTTSSITLYSYAVYIPGHSPLKPPHTFLPFFMQGIQNFQPLYQLRRDRFHPHSIVPIKEVVMVRIDINNRLDE